MKNHKKYPQKEFLYLAGKGKKSYYINARSEDVECIGAYKAIVFLSTGEKILVTTETDNSVYIVMKRGKMRIALHSDQFSLADDKNDSEKIEGIIVLVYQLEDTLDEYHIFFGDTREENYKNLILDSYGFEQSDVLGTLFDILSASYLNISQEHIQDMKDGKLINDNSNQDAAPLD